MDQRHTIHTNILIFGGGIAGLWTLNILRKHGIHALLVETDALGAGQTLKSQGIIHGGLKYALNGVMTKSAEAMAELPNRWKACLQGEGELNLRNVTLNAPCQYLWSNQRLAGAIKNFFASKLLQSRCRKLTPAHYPAIFQSQDFNGSVYQLDEMVLNVKSLIETLSLINKNAIIKIPKDNYQLHYDKKGNFGKLVLPNHEITAQMMIAMAGKGNQQLGAQLKHPPAMQCRPLRMGFIKFSHQLPLYAHCMGKNTLPRLTITTHLANDGSTVWYIGGHPAETGVHQDHHTFIAHLQKELQKLFPWINFGSAQWSSFLVDRAEGQQPNGHKPDGPVIQTINNALYVWPTKLAFAPLVADTVLSIVKEKSLSPILEESTITLPHPAIGHYPWDE